MKVVSSPRCHSFTTWPSFSTAERAASSDMWLNSAVHRIAVTQLRLDGPGRDYYHKRLEAGDTRPMALRALKRRIGRAVYGHLREDHRARQPGNGQPCQQPPS